MKILIIAPNKPNHYHRVRLLNTIKALSQKHQITILYSKQSRFNSYLNCLKNIYKFLPFEVTYCIDKKLQKKISHRFNNFDLIIVKRLRSTINLPNSLSKPILIDTTDAMSLYYKLAFQKSPLFLKPLFLHEFLTYRVFENHISKHYPNWIACSKPDAEYLTKTNPKLNLTIIPNVVDTSYYQTTINPKPNTILFSGILNKQVNILAVKYFINNIWPLLIKNNPDLLFYIVGPSPPHAIRSLQNKNIIITGQVKDLREYISLSSVIIVPLTLGTGTRNKILQAWAMNRPVVTTNIGIQGLNAKHNKHALITNSPKLFAKYINLLLTDQLLVKILTTNAIKLVQSQYSISSLFDSYQKIFKSL